MYLCTNWQIGDGHFERFQDSHGPRCSVIKHFPYTCLQHVGLCGCLGNSHTHLKERKKKKKDVKKTETPHHLMICMNPVIRIETVMQSVFLSYTGAEVVDGLRGETASPESSEGEEAWVVPVSTKSAT